MSNSDDRILLILGECSLALPTPVLTGSGLEFDSQGVSQLNSKELSTPGGRTAKVLEQLFYCNRVG